MSNYNEGDFIVTANYGTVRVVKSETGEFVGLSSISKTQSKEINLETEAGGIKLHLFTLAKQVRNIEGANYMLSSYLGDEVKAAIDYAKVIISYDTTYRMREVYTSEGIELSVYTAITGGPSDFIHLTTLSDAIITHILDRSNSPREFRENIFIHIFKNLETMMKGDK